MRSAAFILLLALTIATPSIAKDRKAELAAAGDNWNALYATGDWAALRLLYTDDAWLMTDKAPAAKSADAIIAYLRRYRDMGASVTFRFEPEDIRVDGKVGTVVAKYWMTAQIPGRPQVHSAGRSMLIYRWVDGQWKLWRDMDNTTPDVSVAQP